MQFRQQASLAAVALVFALPAAAASTSCESLTSLKVPGYDVTITKATRIPAGPPPAQAVGPPLEGTLPAYCRVDGTIDERVGADGKPYAIGFAVALPESWNGRFLFQGGGGLNGNVGQPLGAVAAASQPALARGYAVVSTDSGHKGAGFDATFMKEQEAVLNFLYEAIGKVAPVGKAIVEARYGKPADHSYFVGCSTGGREAMLMSQRYPHYFDGIIAGSPAMRTSFSNLATKYVTVALNAVAPEDASGKPLTAQALSESDKKLVVDSLLKACDAKDGVTDGMIFDTKACGFDPRSLACKGAKTDSCLSPAQANAIAKGFAGPKDSRGNEVYPGWFYDTGITAKVGIPGLLNPGPSPVGPPTVQTTMDVDHDAQIASSPSAAVGDSAHWTQLNTYFQHGGKLIFFHGISDPWFSAKDTIRYYTQLIADNGGADAVMKSSRLFLVPGMGHCSGGAATLDRFDLLTSLENWVEKGILPDSVDATGRAFPGRSRPLCAYPKHAHYKGMGDTEKASSFDCRD